MRRRRVRVRTSSQLQKADALLVLAVVGSVLALGTVHVPVLLVVAPVSIAAGFFALLSSQSGKVPAIALVAAALSAYTLVQVIPLPFGLLSHVAPANADVWERALWPFGEKAPAVATLSLDPGASLVEALKWWSYVAVFVAAASFGRRRGIEMGALLVLGSATILALTSIGHGLANATRVFGVYTPRFGGSGWVIGPLINHNNRAGYLNLGALAGLGLLASARPIVPRWALALAVATDIGVSVNTGSRGGLAALLLGLVVVLLTTRAAHEDAERSPASYRYTVAALALAVAGGAAFAFAASTRYTGQLLSDRNLQKLELIPWVIPVLRDFPVFGIGRGAFESTFPAYRTGADNLVYVAPENFLLQWGIEWGLLVAAVALSSVAWLVRPREWSLRSSPAAGGLFAGVVALVAQNLVDLSLEVASVGILASASIGVAWGHAEREGVEPAGFAVPRWARWALPAVGALLMALVAVSGLHTLAVDRDRVHESFPTDVRDPTQTNAFRALLRGAMERHPAEPYFPRDGALLAMRAGDQNPVPWLQRALERAKTSGRSNYLLATFLASRGYRDQALMQIKLAVAQDPNLTPFASKLILHLARGEADVWKAVPDGPIGAPLLRGLYRVTAPTDEAFALSLLEEAAKRDPKDIGTRFTLSQALLSALEKGDASAACGGQNRESCRKRAATHIARLDELSKVKQEPLTLRARFLRVDGRVGEAIRLLEAECPPLSPRILCLRAWLNAAAFARDRDQVSRAANMLERDACVERTACAGALSEIGDIVSRQDPLASLTYYLRAAREDGTRARWLRAAQMARLTDQHGEAIRALEMAATLGKDPETERTLDQERLKAMAETRGKKP